MFGLSSFVVADADHSDHDCILISIMSHGKLGRIYARDKDYNLEDISGFFTASRCPTLAGKPKIFFIQACQGNRTDGGFTLSRTETDSSDSQSMSYKIPIHADFLIAYSTISGTFMTIMISTNRHIIFVKIIGRKEIFSSKVVFEKEEMRIYPIFISYKN